MSLDHVTLPVTALPRSVTFYDATLAAIGIERRTADGATFAGYGRDGRAFFWIGLRQTAIGSAHIAFAVADRRSVDHFHAAGVAAGGRDHGAPGLRPHYHARYYGAFILDPDGHNIEAVCHAAA